eukprot:5412689-Pleurochrysis_carterae.AAC.2
MEAENCIGKRLFMPQSAAHVQSRVSAFLLRSLTPPLSSLHPHSLTLSPLFLVLACSLGCCHRSHLIETLIMFALSSDYVCPLFSLILIPPQPSLRTSLFAQPQTPLASLHKPRPHQL